jgi:hypothetical protein
MSDALLSLQRAIAAHLNADPVLAALLGGARTFEHVPPQLQPPWIAFEELSARDYGASGVAIHEHRVTLICVSRRPGSREAFAIAARAQELLDDAALPLDGHRLANLRVSAVGLIRAGKEPVRKARLTLRAVTEIQ